MSDYVERIGLVHVYLEFFTAALATTRITDDEAFSEVGMAMNDQLFQLFGGALPLQETTRDCEYAVRHAVGALRHDTRESAEQVLGAAIKILTAEHKKLRRQMLSWFPLFGGDDDDKKIIEKINKYKLCAQIAKMIICESPSTGGAAELADSVFVRRHFCAMLVELMQMIRGFDDAICEDAWPLVSAYAAGCIDKDLADVARKLSTLCQERINELRRPLGGLEGYT